MIATDAGVELESFEHREETGTYLSRYDTKGMPASMAVIATLSKVNGSGPFDMEPLEEHVNTDALDTFFRDPETGTGGSSITFSTAGYTVTVHDDGHIVVTGAGRTLSRDGNGNGSGSGNGNGSGSGNGNGDTSHL